MLYHLCLKKPPPPPFNILIFLDISCNNLDSGDIVGNYPLSPYIITISNTFHMKVLFNNKWVFCSGALSNVIHVKEIIIIIDNVSFIGVSTLFLPFLKLLQEGTRGQ